MSNGLMVDIKIKINELITKGINNIVEITFKKRNCCKILRWKISKGNISIM